MEDGTCKIFLNTKGVHDEQVPEELVRFLIYVGEGNREGSKMAERGPARSYLLRKRSVSGVRVSRPFLWSYITAALEMLLAYSSRLSRRILIIKHPYFSSRSFGHQFW